MSAPVTPQPLHSRTALLKTNVKIVAIAIAVVIGFTLLGAAVLGVGSGAGNDAQLVGAVPDGGAICIDRDGPAPSGQMCFERTEGVLRFRAFGLMANSTLEITGSRGDTMQITIDDTGTQSFSLAGQLDTPPHTATGAWADTTSVVFTTD